MEACNATTRLVTKHSTWTWTQETYQGVFSAFLQIKTQITILKVWRRWSPNTHSQTHTTRSTSWIVNVLTTAAAEKQITTRGTAYYRLSFFFTFFSSRNSWIELSLWMEKKSFLGIGKTSLHKHTHFITFLHDKTKGETVYPHVQGKMT